MAAPSASSALCFRKDTAVFGCFSNFSAHPVQVDGVVWPTTEHFFQGMKPPQGHEEVREEVRSCKTPGKAKHLGRRVPLRDDWDTYRLEVMLTALRAKFSQHPSIGETLLLTGDRELVEDNKSDAFWGCGANGKGKNMLGKLLMQVREEMRSGLTGAAAAGPSSSPSLGSSSASSGQEEAQMSVRALHSSHSI